MTVRTTDATASSASAPSVLALTTTAATVLAANPKRRSLTIQNNSGATVYIGYGTGLTTGNGLQLANGEVLVEEVYTGAVWAMTSSGTAFLPYIEVS